MKTRLIALSEPRIPECKTAEDLVAFCARVSAPSNQANTVTASKLLKYLAKNKHWSPFEMVSLTIEIETTRDIARQILRHRSMSFQEFSQRYAAVLDFSEPREARLQDTKNRQNSIKTDDEKLAQWWEQQQRMVLSDVEKLYTTALDLGIAKEQARAILPEGLTNSRLYMAGTLRSWMHYCALRMGNGTQLEHQEIAKECWAIITAEFPSLEEILND